MKGTLPSNSGLGSRTAKTCSLPRLDFFLTGLFVENRGKGCALQQFNIDILGEMPVSKVC